MKRVAILQSNYIPWKGYFEIIAAVDEFIFYDDMQFTKNDWRNRNRIKTPAGTPWLSIPVGGNIHRRIRDVQLPATNWSEQHWKTLSLNYRAAACFDDVAQWLEPIYLANQCSDLSSFNRKLIESICRYLRIETTLRNSWDYMLVEGKTERLVDLCRQAGGDVYVSGPSARGYLDESAFRAAGMGVAWMQYGPYPEYPQLWGPFVHEVSILDLLFNCGREAARYMKSGQS
ncbi:MULTISPECIES: WbqC family protein [unclassified Cupriavidus]|uniref:WbqC family protein n=1 Tax=Cupriavidus sp. H19C3 TaxID=3241603 RepID=UPI003BF7F56D